MRPQVEDAVRAERSRRAKIEIEEPDRTVDEGKPHGQHGVYGPNGQAVERELHSLFGRLADLPADIGRSSCCEYYCQEVIQADTLCNQVRSL